MCRMILAMGRVDMNELIDNTISMAKDETTSHELNKEKGLGSWTHEDGWGIAYLEEGKWRIIKSIQAIYEDPKFEELRSVNTNLVIIHTRKKMGSETGINNTHPFYIERENDKPLVFCHNGFIDEKISHHDQYTAIGETDSEKLFYSILTDLKNDHIVKAIRRNFRRYKKLTGTNIIISSKEKSVVAIRKNHFPTYYQMHLGKKIGGMVVSSEQLNMKEMTWEPLEAGDVVHIDHATREIELHKDVPTLFEKFKTFIQREEEYTPILLPQ